MKEDGIKYSISNFHNHYKNGGAVDNTLRHMLKLCIGQSTHEISMLITRGQQLPVVIHAALCAVSTMYHIAGNSCSPQYIHSVNKRQPSRQRETPWCISIIHLYNSEKLCKMSQSRGRLARPTTSLAGWNLQWFHSVRSTFPPPPHSPETIS
jgi:hypothetical protein